ncbi:MAG: MFS transporter [Deltaproteobacteria bacterium]|nr:MFS transporter [Deltaproteobacteria bacterium]
MNDSVRANIKILFALTLVHFTGDFYSSFISPLYPLFVEKMGLSLAQVGIISGIVRLLAFIVQPSVGYLADRYSTRHFILIGVLMPIVFIPLSGVTPGFRTLLLVVALGSIGSSMFHPSVTGLVPVYAGRQTGFAMSVFNTGGTFAFGIGPLFITWYAGRFGLTALPFTMALGLMAAWYLYWNVPVPQSEGLRQLGFWGSLKDSLGSVWKTIICIWLVMVIRAVTGQSFLTFMSVYYVEKGFSVFAAGGMFSLFTVAGTISGLIAGHVADRIGFKPVFIFAHSLMCPALILFLSLQNQWVYLGAIMAGAMALATMPLGVAMAQILAPKGRSMVASLMMGFAFGLGGAISPLVGKLADIYSIHTVLMWVSFLPLLSLPFILTFPRVRSA